MWGRPLTGSEFTTATGPRQRSQYRSESRRTHDHNLLSQSGHSASHPGVYVPVYIRHEQSDPVILPRTENTLASTLTSIVL
jgi:hypothetical protein